MKTVKIEDPMSEKYAHLKVDYGCWAHSLTPALLPWRSQQPVPAKFVARAGRREELEDWCWSEKCLSEVTVSFT